MSYGNVFYYAAIDKSESLFHSCFQIERFIRMGVPPSLRGRVWKCLLTTGSLRETSDFNYQVEYIKKCQN